MDPNYHVWYSQFMTTGDQYPTVDDDAQDNLYHLDPMEFNLTLPTYHTFRPQDADLPLSIRAAVESLPTLVYDYDLWSGVLDADAIMGEEDVVETATDPFSFAQRSLQIVQLREQQDDALLSTNGLSESFSDPRRDSGIGSLDDGLEPARQADLSYDSSEDMSGMRLSHDMDCDCQASPSPYPLISSRPAVLRDEVTGTQSPREAPSHPASSPSSSDNHSLPCPLCPGKLFTGVWAHRNLNRHMESIHAPCSSHDGVKHFRCSKAICNRTFRRNDARLVHERRSHPELKRAPATRRKKSGEM